CPRSATRSRATGSRAAGGRTEPDFPHAAEIRQLRERRPVSRRRGLVDEFVLGSRAAHDESCQRKRQCRASWSLKHEKLPSWSTPNAQFPTPNAAYQERLGVGSWKLGISVRAPAVLCDRRARARRPSARARSSAADRRTRTVPCRPPAGGSSFHPTAWCRRLDRRSSRRSVSRPYRYG